jgi:hypothetical protein
MHGEEQSVAQLFTFSPQAESHILSPQTHGVAQSTLQVRAFSLQLGSHDPSPQMHVEPQSCGQFTLDSPH